VTSILLDFLKFTSTVFKVSLNLIVENSHYLVMELLGPSLSDLMKICGGKFSLGTTVFLAMQIVILLLF